MPSIGRVRTSDRGVEFATGSVATPDALGWATIALSALVVAAVMAAPFSPIGKAFGDPGRLKDFGVHIENAKALSSDGITFPHFLWHALVIAVHTAIPSVSWIAAGHVVVIGSYGLQGALLAWIVTTVVAAPTRRIEALAAAFLVLLLVVAAPVTILTWREDALYFGYLNMDSYASPTHALLKPLALVVFFYTCRAFSHRRGLREGIALGTAVVLSGLAKPSLLICLLPATGVVGALHRLGRRAVRPRYLVGAFLLPCLAVLTWQYLVYFVSPVGGAADGRSTVLFAPFLVMGHYATWLGPKFLMSILLPLTVLAVYPRDVLASSAMQLAWLQFAFAAAYSYLLAETRLTLAGNFVWSGQIATYLLYVSSTIFALRQWTGGWRCVLCLLAFGLHEICGVLFFLSPYKWGPVR